MDLERLEMTVSDFPLCFFSDVHGDVDMLRHLFANERNRCRNFFCVGDLVDYRRAPVVSEHEGVCVTNLGHLGRGVVGDPDPGYVVLHADGSCRRM